MSQPRPNTGFRVVEGAKRSVYRLGLIRTRNDIAVAGTAAIWRDAATKACATLRALQDSGYTPVHVGCLDPVDLYLDDMSRLASAAVGMIRERCTKRENEDARESQE